MSQEVVEMKEVMSILDKFKLDDLGVVISGVNSNYDKLGKERIEGLIGKSIIIRNLCGSETEIKVKQVDISRSLIGKTNISIELEDIIELKDLEVNSIV
ncbi:MAG: hypothetical protein ETSY2_50875, partial [Candidatus Entotheonella gemina]